MRYLTMKEVAERFRVSVRTVKRWNDRKDFPRRLQIGPNSFRYSAEEIEAFEARENQRQAIRVAGEMETANA